MKYLLIFALLFAGCSESTKDKDYVEKVSKNLLYFKETTTNLCFAEITNITYYGYYSVSISCVPCDSVKAVLTKSK